MGVTCENWKNKGGTANRSCKCGSWKNHWINNSSVSWPDKCSVKNCNNKADRGLHVYNAEVVGEKIIAGCSSCNNLNEKFSLKGGITLVSANKSETCSK